MNRRLAVVESVVDCKPDNTPMEFDCREEGIRENGSDKGGWKHNRDTVIICGKYVYG